MTDIIREVGRGLLQIGIRRLLIQILLRILSAPQLPTQSDATGRTRCEYKTNVLSIKNHWKSPRCGGAFEGV